MRPSKSRNTVKTTGGLTTFILSAFILSAFMETSIPGTVMAGEKTTAAESDSTLFDLSAYKGKVIYLDFWASWCKPCKQSFPWMRAMQARFGNQGFEVVAVDMDRDRKAAESFLKQNPAAFRIFHDPEGKLAEAYQIEAMPTSLLFDRQGQQRAVHLGFRESETEAWESEIISLLSETPPDTTRR